MYVIHTDGIESISLELDLHQCMDCLCLLNAGWTGCVVDSDLIVSSSSSTQSENSTDLLMERHM